MSITGKFIILPAAALCAVVVVKPQSSVTQAVSSPVGSAAVQPLANSEVVHEDQVKIDVYAEWQPVAVSLTGHSSVDNWSDY